MTSVSYFRILYNRLDFKTYFILDLLQMFKEREALEKNIRQERET